MTISVKIHFNYLLVWFAWCLSIINYYFLWLVQSISTCKCINLIFYLWMKLTRNIGWNICRFIFFLFRIRSISLEMQWMTSKRIEAKENNDRMHSFFLSQNWEARLASCTNKNIFFCFRVQERVLWPDMGSHNSRTRQTWLEPKKNSKVDCLKCGKRRCE